MILVLWLRTALLMLAVRRRLVALCKYVMSDYWFCRYVAFGLADT